MGRLEGKGSSHLHAFRIMSEAVDHGGRGRPSTYLAWLLAQLLRLSSRAFRESEMLKKVFGESLDPAPPISESTSPLLPRAVSLRSRAGSEASCCRNAGSSPEGTAPEADSSPPPELLRGGTGSHTRTECPNRRLLFYLGKSQ
jgi:hypothetical protein